MGLVQINKGKDFQFTLNLVDKDGGHIDLTGFTFIKLQMKNTDGTIQELCEPSLAAVDEVQKIVFDAVPDGGTWFLTFGTRRTASLAFDADAAAIQVALRALKSLSAVTVTGNYLIKMRQTLLHRPPMAEL